MSMKTIAGMTGIVGVLLLPGVSLAQQGAMPPQQVGVVTLTSQEVPRVFTLPGRAVASEQAGIKPRVNGIITQTLYEPGQAIGAGDPMFRIEPEVYEAAVSQAEADVASSQAALTQAQSAFDRASQLVGSGISRADLEASEATLRQAEASLQSSEAQLQLAQQELSWTTVTSPIDGMASVPFVTVGTLVSSTQTENLAMVTKLDPIEVDMYEPSGRIQAIRDDIEAGRVRLNEAISATLTLDNGTTYSAQGSLVAPGYTVSTTTGTVDIRFRFENAEARIYPGMFVRGQVNLGSTDALLVPQSATTRGRDGQLRAWIVEDGKAVQHSLTEDGVFENSWIVTAGIETGSQLIVDGLASLAPGADVTPVPVEYDEDGVIQDVEKAE